MIIKFNGNDFEINKEATLQDIINDKGLDASKIVVEYNKEIIPKDRFTGILISESDTVEILSFVGGG